MYIYKMTNKVNGMSYVGATTRTIKRRLADHVNASRRGRTSLIAQAIREFGISSFETRILLTVESGSYEDLMVAEIAAIKEHGTMEPVGYNRSSGGIGTPDCRHLESTKLKIGATSKGRIPNEEARRKMSLAHKGKPCPWNVGPTGRPAWNRGIPAPPELKAKLSMLRMGAKNPIARRIEFRGVEYGSIADAVRATGFSMMQICYRLAKGDSARYLDNPHKEKK